MNNTAVYEADGGGMRRKPSAVPPPLPLGVAAVPPERSALEPFYDARASAPERAEIRLEDLSLDSTNPFVGSSLLPPPPKRRPWLKPVLVMAIAGLLVGAGYGGALLRLREGGEPRRQPMAAAPAETQVAPQLTAAAPEAPEAEPPAPAQAVTQRPPAEVVQASLPKPAVSRVRPAPVLAAVSSAPRVRPAPETEAVAVVEEVAPPVPPAPAAALTLSRDQVRIGLESVRAALQNCADGGLGSTMANVTISGAGRITYAFIEGAFAGTPQGSCMARALRAAQFPPFTSSPLRVRYPFVF